MVRKTNRNLLPLLAFTGILLSVGLVSFNRVGTVNVNTQSVLSKSTENREPVPQRSTSPKVWPETSARPSVVKIIKDTETAKIEVNTPIGIIRVEPRANETEKGKVVMLGTPVPAGSPKPEFKLDLNNVIGNLGEKSSLDTNIGKLEIVRPPNDSVNKIVTDGLIDLPKTLEIKADATGSGSGKSDIQYEVQGIDNRKLFGLIDISLPKTITVSGTTGDVLSTSQNVWTKFLNFLSI